MTKRKFPVFVTACVLWAFVLFSCGLQDVPYIGRVLEPAHTSLSGTDEFRLPSSGDIGFGSMDPFTHFVIFYRIYLSNVFHGADTVDASHDRISINSQLNADYNAAFSWTDPTNAAVNTAGVHNFFVNTRGFFPLELEGNAIGGHNGVLGGDSLGRAMRIDFSGIPGQAPRLWLDNRSYYLRRAGGIGDGFDFEPLPRLGNALPFFNHMELLDGENRTNRTVNADVALQVPTGGQIEHSYVMMYIAASGLSLTAPPVRVFSQPTFLGIFRLPSPGW